MKRRSVMELYVYGAVALAALVGMALGIVAAARDYRNSKIVERRLRRPF